MILQPENIPEVLKNNHICWVLWRIENRGNGPTKVPYSPQSPDKHASVSEVWTWSNFNKTLIEYRKGGFDGIGIVFTHGLVGIDLDDAYDPWTERLEGWAKEIVDRFPTYSEFSPSGTGIKLFVSGSLPIKESGRKKIVQGGLLEVYHTKRFFTVTGDICPWATKEIQQHDLTGWFSLEFPPRKEAEYPEIPLELPHDREFLCRRASKYMAKVPPAISGQRGHDQTFKAACILKCEFGLTDPEAISVLAEWNRTCLPPWEEYDLKRKLREAGKQPVTLRLALEEK